ncbi:MAG: twin-arginine translocation signal domain-containing protein, partial [Halalkalicoccus sp.]
MSGDDGGIRVGDTELSRREVLGGLAGAAGAAGLGVFGYRRLQPEEEVEGEVMNPLAEYPDQGWEDSYRDVWDRDDSYMLTCTPNDTHNCYLEASVKNGVITRLGPSMNYGEATDLYGTETTQRWDPRVCNKGLAMIERFYSERRVDGTALVTVGAGADWDEVVAGLVDGKLGRQPRLVRADGTFSIREREFGPLPSDLVMKSVDVEIVNGVVNVYYDREL